jgi:dihydrofolate synthase / folylpolyglutamate synthase
MIKEHIYKEIRKIEGEILSIKPTVIPCGDNKGVRPYNINRVKFILESIGLLNNIQKLSFIHVTGTSGKGTVCNTVHDSLVKCGYRAGIFTSPHITSIIERIKLNNLLIDPKDFINIYNELKPKIDSIVLSKGVKYRPIFFDYLLIISLVYFLRKKCDVIILEAGIGGKNDSTNFIENPVVTAITNIGLDHMEYLGNTKAKIAKDKSGIIKKGSVFVTYEKNSRHVDMFKKKCILAGAKFIDIKKELTDFKDDEQGALLTKNNEWLSYAIAKNFIVKDKDTEKNVKKLKLYYSKLLNSKSSVKLPGRFEIIGKNILLDVAHNPEKINFLIKNIKRSEFATEKINLLLAISKDKNAMEIIKNILRSNLSICNVILTTFTVKRPCHDPEYLKDIFIDLNFKGKLIVKKDPLKSFGSMRGKLSKNDLIVVTGSFYLVGDIRSLYYSEKEVLGRRSVW